MARIPVPGLAAALLLTALAAGLASCEDTEEDTSQAATEPPTASATTSPTATIAPTATPEGASAPTATPVPGTEDWKTYEDPGGLFRMKYPPDWRFAGTPSPPAWVTVYSAGSLYSFQPTGGPNFPADGTKIDIEIELSATDNRCMAVPEGAFSTSLGGVQGWRLERELEDFDARLVSVAAAHGERCYRLLGYLGPDAETNSFDQVADTFSFVET